MPDTGNRITPLRTARIAFELYHLTDFRDALPPRLSHR